MDILGRGPNLKMEKNKKETLEERVAELEAEVKWLNWLVDKHIYNPKYYYTETFPKPDPLKGWNVT